MHETDLSQLLFVKLSDLHWNSSLEHTLRRLRPGGVLVDAPLPNAPENVREFLSKVAYSVPTVPLLAIREEGGVMDPLQAILPPLPSPRMVADKGLAAVRRLGELVGAAFEVLGFNTNFAPLLDLGSVSLNQASGTPWRAPAEQRAFGADPQRVAKCGEAFLEGLESHEVRACGKHFPGLGSARPTSATDLPMVSKSMAELWREDLVPYRALLPRLPMILVSTAAYKAYDFDVLKSAVLSSQVVEGLLRVKLGYHGVAIAYGLESEAVRGTLSFEEAAVQAVGAGCDMLLLEETRAAEPLHAVLSAALESGKLLRPRTEQALKRLQLVKHGLRPPADKLPPGTLAKLTQEFQVFTAGFAGAENHD